MARAVRLLWPALAAAFSIASGQGLNAVECRNPTRWHSMLHCPDNYACHVCVQVLTDLQQNHSSDWCGRVGGCHILNASSARLLGFNGSQDIRAFCQWPADLCPVEEPWDIVRRQHGTRSPIDVRVTKAMGRLGYEYIRVSVISLAATMGASASAASRQQQTTSTSEVIKRQAASRSLQQHTAAGGSGSHSQSMNWNSSSSNSSSSSSDSDRRQQGLRARGP